MEEFKEKEELQEEQEKSEETQTPAGPQSEPEPAESLSEMDYGVQQLSPGSIVTGKVVSVDKERVLVDVGYKSEGFIPLSELSHRKVEDPAEIVSEGDEIEVKVLSVEGEEGNLVLSKRRADEEKAWDKLEAALESGEVLEVPVVEEVKGGLLADVGLRGFIPASHVGRGFVSNLGEYVGKDLRVKVIELDRGKNRVILSHKVVEEEEYERKREETWAKIAEGQVVKGVVKGLTDFGAFIDLGGVDGLLHISEMAWGRVGHASEVLSVGDEVEVMVLKVDRERGRISLGRKQVLPDPWENVDKKYPAGSTVEGKVMRLAPFGAFVELEPGVEGLVHISELANRRVATPDEVVSPGEKVQVKVLKVDPAERRISLSIRALKPVRQKKQHDYIDEDKGVATIGDMFGDLLEETKENIDK